MAIASGHVRVITASCLGTIFEWYDFYLYGELTDIIADHFFTHLPQSSAFIMALLTFAAGFAVRPIGSLVFGNFGDKIGRKYSFLVTIIVMGISTFLVGMLPTYETIGVAAPIILVSLRCIQGFAVGGEYGGAATYVAEHAPKNRRGLFTSFIQATADVGLLICLVIIIVTRGVMGEEKFKSWGWRIPYLLSIFLLGISIFIRMKLQESPVFQEMKAAGKQVQMPLKESFIRWRNFRMVLLVLFGIVAGQAVVGYASGFYVYYFLTQTLKLSSQTAGILQAIDSIYNICMYVVFGWLSDKIGRKPIIMTGCLLAAITYYPLFIAFDHFVTSTHENVTVLGRATPVPTVHSNNFIITILWICLTTYSAMAYGPMGAWLVELFPTKVRYSSISLPYHIGNGWIGGFMPSIAFGLVNLTGDKYAGLWYPIGITGLTFVIGTLFLRETKDIDLRDDEMLDDQIRTCYVWNPFEKCCKSVKSESIETALITSL